LRLDEACLPAFARHETFHPRYGWLKKAVDAASAEEDLFNRDDAVIQLGVGKNMVRSIRHWGHAFKLLDTEPVPGSRRPRSRPTPIGADMFADGGIDPYCEVPGTLWLLHWWLLAPPSISPVWWVAFNEFPGLEFTEEELQQFALDCVSDWAHPQASSVKKDVSALLRMYSSGEGLRATFDDRIDCPFRELGLIQPSNSVPGGYRFQLGPKPTLPSLIFAAAVVDYAIRNEATSSTISLSRAVSDIGSPGRAFKLSEKVVLELLTDAVATTTYVKLSSAAGVPQLVVDGDLVIARRGLLQDHYSRFGRRVPATMGNRKIA
jgi:hypothetical protein